ncbi:MAG TPA: ankyrin repeat domain-containing protein [Gemmatimonadaceae bacterium]
MAGSKLPDRASLEYLKKLAKERLQELRKSDPDAKLTTAQLAIAREHGFPSWRALKAEVDRRRTPLLEAFFAACEARDADAIRELLDRDPNLVHARHTSGSTPLHQVVSNPEAVRVLLERGADPNVRDTGDNALPLHFAVADAPIESVRLLLDAGSDVHGVGDAHQLEAIGWATCFRDARRDVADLLVSRGARHHVFSAIALDDPELLRRVIADDPRAIHRRLSPYEQEQTALHYVIAPPDGLIGGTFRTGDHYQLLDVLIEAGADLEATDAKGRTPLLMAMLKGDQEAMRRLHAAGARAPKTPAAAPRAEPAQLRSLAPSMTPIRPMIGVSDVNATVAWYQSIGFELRGSHEENGVMNWAAVGFGKAILMFTSSGSDARYDRIRLSLWIDTDRLDELYAALKERQLARSRAVLAGEPTDIPEVRFTADLYTAVYGQREFGIRDPNGVEIMFAQPLD